MRTNAISGQWHVLVLVLCTQVIGSRWRWGRRDEGRCGNGRREKGDSDLTYLSLGKQDYVATDACLPGTNLHLPPSSPPSICARHKTHHLLQDAWLDQLKKQDGDLDHQ